MKMFKGLLLLDLNIDYLAHIQVFKLVFRIACNFMNCFLTFFSKTLDIKCSMGLIPNQFT